MRKEIIDNEKDQYTMSQFLNDELVNDRNKGSLSISSGYFNIGGYSLIRDKLCNFSKKPDFNLRLLFGREAIKPDDERKSFESILEEIPDANEETNLQQELSSLELEWQSVELVDDLINFLSLPGVSVRTNKNRFNHSKCYIFDDSAAVGSSNLTRAGLARNVELNAILYQPSYQKELLVRDKRRWADADDAKSELIQSSRPRSLVIPLDPFRMYMKLLYEYYRPRLKEIDKARDTRIELTEFQRDAAVSSLRIIEKYGGVIISDSTGLGKTHIGLSLLRDLPYVTRKKILLIAPKQVLDAVWEPRLEQESIKTRSQTLEGTGTENFDSKEVSGL